MDGSGPSTQMMTSTAMRPNFRHLRIPLYNLPTRSALPGRTWHMGGLYPATSCSPLLAPICWWWGDSSRHWEATRHGSSSSGYRSNRRAGRLPGPGPSTRWPGRCSSTAGPAPRPSTRDTLAARATSTSSTTSTLVLRTVSSSRMSIPAPAPGVTQSPVRASVVCHGLPLQTTRRAFGTTTNWAIPSRFSLMHHTDICQFN